MKKIVLCVGVLLFGFSSLGLAEMKIGVLDVKQVLKDLPQIKDVQAKLKKEFDPRGKELVNLQNTLRSDFDKYKQNSANLKGEELKKEQQKIIDENKKLQDTRRSLQQDLITVRNKELSPILEQMNEVVKKIAQEKKIDLVITKTSAAYVNSQFEITDQVIVEMKKPVPTVSVVKAK